MLIATVRHYVTFKTIVRKEITRFLRIWTQTLLPPAITMTLYFIIFGRLIGSQIKAINGFTYMQFIVPGLIMMSIMTNAYSNTSSSFFGAKFSRSIEELLVSPTPNYIIIIGYALGGVLRGLLTGLVVFSIALIFTSFNVHSYFVLITLAILSAIVFALAGLVNAIYAKKFDDISFIPTFVLTPLTYFGGVFYSITQLPSMWQTVSRFNPIFNIVDSFRYGLLGIADVNIYFGFLFTCLLVIILYGWCLNLLKRGTGLRT